MRAAVVLLAGALAGLACTNESALPAPPSAPANRSGGEEVAAPPPNSADAVVVVLGCDELAALSDAELDERKAAGIDGFACNAGPLRGLGGPNAFDPVPDAPLDGPEHDLQRQLRDSAVAERAHARDLTVQLGFAVAGGLPDAVTPFVDWFDDAGWSGTVVPDAVAVAATASALGFDGLLIDAAVAGGGPSWSWAYAGSERPEADVRAQVTRRGTELMTGILSAFPEVDLFIAGWELFGSWGEEVRFQLEQVEGAFLSDARIDFVDGLTSVDGYAAVRLSTSTFSTGVGVDGRSFDEALRHDTANLYTRLSQELSNWAAAAELVHSAPAAALAGGEGADSVDERLDALSTWSTGDALVVVAPLGLAGLDDAGTSDALQAASSSRPVDRLAPTIEVTEEAVSGATATLRGVADDDFAVRLVSWRTDGGSGVARMTWEPMADAPALVHWSVEGIPVVAGSTTAVHLAVVDVKDLVTELTVDIRS